MCKDRGWARESKAYRRTQVSNYKWRAKESKEKRRTKGCKDKL